MKQKLYLVAITESEGDAGIDQIRGFTITGTLVEL